MTPDLTPSAHPTTPIIAQGENVHANTALCWAIVKSLAGLHADNVMCAAELAVWLISRPLYWNTDMLHAVGILLLFSFTNIQSVKILFCLCIHQFFLKGSFCSNNIYVTTSCRKLYLSS